MSEKRYFSIFSERHIIGTKNKYLVLFTELEKAKNEDDRIISGNLAKAGLRTGFLSADKNYLYRLLLRSLNDFHSGKTLNIRVKQALISIEILFHKGLYSQCLKLIDRAESISVACENFQLVIDVLTWKKKCVGYSHGLNEAAQINKAIDKYLLLSGNLKRFTDLYYESNLLQANNEKSSKADVVRKFRSILNQPELQSEKHALSFSARIFFHLVYSNYYYTIDDKQNELKQVQRLANMLQKSETYATENPLDYLSIYNRLLSIKKHYNIPSFFDDIKQLKAFSKQVSFQNELVALRALVHCNTHELEYYLIRNDLKSALKKTREFTKENLPSHVDIEPYHMIYYHYLQAVAFVFTGNFTDALTIVNRLLNEFDMNARPQVYTRLQVLNTMIHYELNNLSIVLSLSKQILKKDSAKKTLTLFETLLLKAFIKIAKLKHPGFKDEADIFRELPGGLHNNENLNQDPNYNMTSNYRKWVYGKTQRNHLSKSTTF